MKKIPLFVILALGFSSISIAQAQEVSPAGMRSGMQDGMQTHHTHREMSKRDGMERFEGLHLTSEQKDQIHSIMENSRGQMKQNREENRQKIDAILTPEQREKLKERREHMGHKRKMDRHE